jgi:predicted acyl esterase
MRCPVRRAARRREFSDAELDDLEETVGLLAAKSWSNGSIGMMGKSWAGFKAIVTALRRPPASSCASSPTRRPFT